MNDWMLKELVRDFPGLLFLVYFVATVQCCESTDMLSTMG